MACLRDRQEFLCGHRVIAATWLSSHDAAIRALTLGGLHLGGASMARFVGLDVSQKLTSICVVDDTGRRVWRGQCATSPPRNAFIHFGSKGTF